MSLILLLMCFLNFLISGLIGQMIMATALLQTIFGVTVVFLFFIIIMILAQWFMFMIFYLPLINYGYTFSVKWDSFTRSFNILKKNPFKVITFMLLPSLIFYLLKIFIANESFMNLSVHIENIKNHFNAGLISSIQNTMPTNLKNILSTDKIIDTVKVTFHSIYFSIIFINFYKKT